MRLVCQNWLYVMFSLLLSRPFACSPTFLFCREVATLPFSSTLPFSLHFSWPTDFLSHILSDPLCFMLPQPTCLPLSFSLPLPQLPFFQFGCLRGEQVGQADGLHWISLVLVKVLMYSIALWQWLEKPSGCFRYTHTLHWIHAPSAMVMNYSLCFHWAEAQEMGWGGWVKEIWAEERRGSSC